MNFLLGKLTKIVGIEKLFLMVWNVVFPALLEKLKKTAPVWDEKVLLLLNELIILVTGKKSGSDDAHPEISKPQALIQLEEELNHAA